MNWLLHAVPCHFVSCATICAAAEHDFAQHEFGAWVCDLQLAASLSHKQRSAIAAQCLTA